MGELHPAVESFINKFIAEHAVREAGLVEEVGHWEWDLEGCT